MIAFAALYDTDNSGAPQAAMNGYGRGA